MFSYVYVGKKQVSIVLIICPKFTCIACLKHIKPPPYYCTANVVKNDKAVGIIAKRIKTISIRWPC